MNALETFITSLPIKATMLSTPTQQSQSGHQSSNFNPHSSLFNNFTSNNYNSNFHHLLQTCLCHFELNYYSPTSLLYYPFHNQLTPHFHHHHSLVLLAHQRFENVSGLQSLRTFQRTKNLSKQDDRDLRAWHFQYPKFHRLDTHHRWKTKWRELQLMRHFDTPGLITRLRSKMRASQGSS